MPSTPFDWMATGDALVAWMLTYLLHSTLLLALAAAANRLLPRAQLAARETLWKTALLGGLLTATLQTGLAIEPLAGAWRVAAAPGRPAAIEAPAVRAVPVTATLASPAPLASRPAGVPETRFDVPAREVATSPASAGSESTPTRTAGSWRAWIASLWLLGGTLLLALLGLSHLRFERRLAGRRDLAHGHLRQLLDGLLATLPRRRPVRLTASARVKVPLARGVRRREICFPERALTELAPERQEVVLAHELAHLERRDPLWLLVTRVVERLLFFQPLNRLARHRLQEIAEYRCDDWAVERTGRPVSMARCLTEVAEWGLAGGAGLPAPAMAVDRSRLGRRVRRLLDRAYPVPAAERPRWLRPALLAVLAATVVVAPAVLGARPVESDVPEVPAEEQPAGDAGEPAAAPSAEVSTPRPPATPPSPATAAPPPAPLPRLADPASSPADATRLAPRPAAAPLAPVAPAPATVPAPDVAPVPAAAPVPIEAPGNLTLDLSGLVPAAEMARLEAEVERAASEMAWTRAEIAAASEEIARLQATELHRLEREMESGMEELAAHLAEISRPDPEALARLEEMAREMAERHAPDPAAMARLQELTERAQPDPEALARLEEMATRLAEAARPDPEALARLEEMARRMAEKDALSAEERARLREEARRIASEARPSAEEIERLREEARRVAEQTRLSEAERQELRREARRIAEQTRLTEGERAVIRQEARRIAEQARLTTEERAALREEARRIAREARPAEEEIERLREELRALREQRRRHPEELERERRERVDESAGQPGDGG